MLDLDTDGLAALLGSRTRALAARRWVTAERPVPRELPERVPGVRPESWQLVREAGLPPWRITSRRVSTDGTVKLAVALGADTVETVLIPTATRGTVCVSSQSGCTRSCGFCATASLGFRRNLTAGEIVLQYLLAQAEAPVGLKARNVVFMGMGEPMDNLDAVMAATTWLQGQPAPALSAGHVTVSTSGVLPGMKRFLREGRGHLALSLNATTDRLRRELMPHTATWPIAALLDALREDQALLSGRRYFIEYVLWDGVNDSLAEADRLADLLIGLDAHVNLIPHNPSSASPLRPSPDVTVEAFRKALAARAVRALVRWPRGQEIAAACGQLALQAGA